MIRKGLERLLMSARFRIHQVFQTNLGDLLKNAEPKAPLGERVEWIEQLLTWIRMPVLPSPERKVPQDIQAVRARFVMKLLRREPELRERVGSLIFSVLLESEPLNLFCLTGLSRKSGFFSEAFDRVMRKLLPAPRDERDLAELFARIFSSEQDAIWLQDLGSETQLELFSIIAPTEERRRALKSHFDQALRDALTILSSQIESLGLSPEIRLRSGVERVRESAFWKLRHIIAKSDLLSAPDGEPDQLMTQVIACRKEVATALEHLERHGVSIDIVYRLEQIEWFLYRIEILTYLSFESEYESESHSELWIRLLTELIRDSIEASRIAPLVQDNLHLLARKVVERTGESGEHYITRSKSEYFGMLLSAAGGGVLTTLTALMKFVVTKLHVAPFFEGFLSWLNFAGSFLAMQALGLTLATKQPSMTAPALAAKLRDFDGHRRLDEFVDEVANITRSQFISAVGNVGAVIPCAIAFNFIFTILFGRHVLSSDYALKIISSLNPLTSMTIPFAALTGVLLWMSSLVAGWIENWFTYRRLPTAIAQSRLLSALLGREAAGKLSSWLTNHVSGIGGNVSLGFFLAFTPVFSRFFGLGLDVRHVTLSAGSLAFAIAALPLELLSFTDLILSSLGILIIGSLNFGVSFALALSVAIKAQNAKREWITEIFKQVWIMLRRHPGAFFFPKSLKKAAPSDS